MVVGARVIGVLEFCGPQVDALTSDAMQVVETLAVHAGTAIDAARMHESTTEMALTDVPHIVALRDRGALVEPVLVPRYLADPLARRRLAEITARTVPLELIGAAA